MEAARLPDVDERGYWTRGLSAPTADDVSMTMDGRRLDSLDAWVAYLVECGRLPAELAHLAVAK